MEGQYEMEYQEVRPVARRGLIWLRIGTGGGFLRMR